MRSPPFCHPDGAEGSAVCLITPRIVIHQLFMPGCGVCRIPHRSRLFAYPAAIYVLRLTGNVPGLVRGKKKRSHGANLARLTGTAQ
jgi:hypothetical protein